MASIPNSSSNFPKQDFLGIGIKDFRGQKISMKIPEKFPIPGMSIRDFFSWDGISGISYSTKKLFLLSWFKLILKWRSSLSSFNPMFEFIPENDRLRSRFLKIFIFKTYNKRWSKFWSGLNKFKSSFRNFLSRLKKDVIMDRRYRLFNEVSNF